MNDNLFYRWEEALEDGLLEGLKIIINNKHNE